MSRHPPISPLKGRWFVSFFRCPFLVSGTLGKRGVLFNFGKGAGCTVGESKAPRKPGRPFGSKSMTPVEKQKEMANRGKPKNQQLNENMLKAARMWVFGKDDGTAVQSKKQLAELVGVSKHTILEYFEKEKWLAEVDRLQKEQLRENKQSVGRYTQEAINTLVDCMRNAGAARDRITAAKTILDMAGMNDKTINVNVGGEIGVVRGGFGKEVIDAATSVAESAIDVEYEVLDDGNEEVSVNDLL